MFNESTSMILIWVVMFAFIYVFIFRPQLKREKQRKKLLESLSKNQDVVTIGGIYGKIVGFKNNGDIVELQVSDQVLIKVQRSAIGGIQNTES